jgi:hypothetical protein
MLATITLAVLAVLAGAALLLAGYRFFLVMLPIWGFLGGFWIGAYTVSLILSGGFLATTTGLVTGAVVGIAGAVFSYLFYTVGAVIIGAALGGTLGSGVMGALGFDPGLIMAIVTLVSALVGAGLTLWFNLQKYAIMAMTAVAGAVLVAFSGMLLFGQITLAELQTGRNLIQPVFEGSWFWSIVWLVLTIAGVVLQIRTNRTYTFHREMYVEGWG